MSGFWLPPDDFDYQQLSASGYAGYVSGQTTPQDIVDLLHRTIEEVTKVDYSKPKQKIGFY